MITIILVIYKSKKKLLKSFIKKLNNSHELIIVNNSKNYNFSNLRFPKKTKIIKTFNNGYGAALNLGLKACKTKHALISNIDVKFKKNFIDEFYDYSKTLNNFTILIPNHGKKYSNELTENYDGEAALMIVDVKKILKIKFDEKYFLYYEETDLFKRCQKLKQKVFIVNKLRIKHERSSSILQKNDIMNVMKWHYMWSMFYFYKKNYNYFYALKKTYTLILKDLIMMVYYIISFDKKNFNLRLSRLSGIMHSIFGLPSLKRPL